MDTISINHSKLLLSQTLFNLSSYLQAGHRFPDLTDPVHPANFSLELRQILGPGQRRAHRLGALVDRDEAGGADVERIVLVVIDLMLVSRVLVARLLEKIFVKICKIKIFRQNFIIKPEGSSSSAGPRRAWGRAPAVSGRSCRRFYNSSV